MKQHAVVVGAGLAGLASAISLSLSGWRVTVLERSATLQEVGAGFAMSRNAVAAFRGLGFDDGAVAALGAPTWASGTWTAQGKPLMTVQQTPSTQLIGVHRRRLHQMLHRRADDLGVEIITESPVTALQPGAPGEDPA
ncbi:NAD(P)-binding protein [Nesterenkonia sp. MY13]|uniref:NAD(P)-binding protein n=1 Tax=Nesterenkonia sedimenti TaxID=1463632 RepID=A0A7X8TIT9_9MICC|nr:NAD(P)-binding protein [Nesterenkonia sedimenti]